MDPITAAIIAALAVGVTSGLTEASKTAIVDAYTVLKTKLKTKFGVQSDVVKSVENLETKPESTGRQATLQEEIKATNATQDPELLSTAQMILDKIKAQPGGEQHIQNVIGNYNATVQGSGNPTVNVNQPNTHE